MTSHNSIEQRTPVPVLSALRSLATAEVTLLMRSTLQMFTAVLLPLFLVLLCTLIDFDDPGGLGIGRSMANIVVVILTFAVYLNLTSAYVGRRQELVLRRLHTGECSNWIILAGIATPAAILATIMNALIVLLSHFLLDVPWPQAPVILAIGTLMGILVMVSLAVLTASMTASVESAQITSLPVISVIVLSAGLAVPLSMLPTKVAALCRLLPGAPIGTLSQLGWLGVSPSGEQLTAGQLWHLALPQLLLLSAWIVGVSIVAYKTFRVHPR